MVEMVAPSMNENWRDLYRAALFEENKRNLPVRIANAEKKIAARSRELSNSGHHTSREKSALNLALYALAALRSSLKRDERDFGQGAVA
jgi:hypothetical protein